MVTAMGQVTPALSIVSDKLDSLKAYGVDKDEILLTTDAVAKTTPEAVASDLLQVVQVVIHLTDDVVAIRLDTPDMVKTHLLSIKYAPSHSLTLFTQY